MMKRQEMRGTIDYKLGDIRFQAAKLLVSSFETIGFTPRNCWFQALKPIVPKWVETIFSGPNKGSSAQCVADSFLLVFSV